MLNSNVSYKENYVNFLVLLKKYQENKSYSLLEELYSYLYPVIRKISRSMLKKYNYICNDEDEYLFIIFDATKLAIDTYKEERGNFDNYWNTLIRNKKSKFITEKYNLKNRYVKSFSLNDSEELETFEKLTFHDSAKSSFDQKTNSMYLLDVRKRIFKILDSCTIFDKKIFALYLESYNFNEIAKILNVTRNKIIARFYYLCKIIRSRIDVKDYF